MAEHIVEKKDGNQVRMTIDDREVTLSFTEENNPMISDLVRNILLDAYIRKNIFCADLLVK